MNRIFLLLSIFFALNPSLSAQEEEQVVERRFNGGFVYGFNSSQINGDGLAGYHKLGLYAGIVANANLTPKTYLSTGITFSQRGSATALNSQNTARIRFDIIELPLIFHYKDKETEDGYHQVHFGTGFCYGRLFNVEAGGTPYLGHESKFSPSNINWLLDAMFYKNKHIGFGIRYNRAINRIYKNSTVPAPVAVFLEHWITFKGIYIF